jgi:toxin FitB
MYLIDTNIISEIRKGRRCDPRVAAWYRAARDDELFLSVLVVGEIRQGIERLRPRNARQATALENWLEEILGSFGERVLPINERVAQIWGRLKSSCFLVAGYG